MGLFKKQKANVASASASASSPLHEESKKDDSPAKAPGKYSPAQKSNEPQKPENSQKGTSGKNEVI